MAQAGAWRRLLNSAGARTEPKMLMSMVEDGETVSVSSSTAAVSRLGVAKDGTANLRICGRHRVILR